MARSRGFESLCAQQIYNKIIYVWTAAGDRRYSVTLGLGRWGSDAAWRAFLTHSDAKFLADWRVTIAHNAPGRGRCPFKLMVRRALVSVPPRRRVNARRLPIRQLRVGRMSMRKNDRTSRAAKRPGTAKVRGAQPKRKASPRNRKTARRV